MVLGCALDSFTGERIYEQKCKREGYIYWLQHSSHKEEQKQSESVPANVTIKEEVAWNRLKHIEEL